MFTVLLLVILVPLILFLYVFFLHDFTKGPDARLKRTPYKGFIGNARVFDPENHYQNAYELFRVHADKVQYPTSDMKEYQQYSVVRCLLFVYEVLWNRTG